VALPSLPALLGVPANAGCLLGLDQVRQLATLAVRRRPADLYARVIFGGPLGDLDEGTPWGDAWQSAPFLMIAGEQGALALVSRAEGERFRCVMLSDPERVDHAVMALAQFGDETLNLPELAAPEPQRAFVATLVAALVADPRLNAVDLHALLPAERRWIDLARVFGRCPDLPALFATPDLRQALHEQRVERALIGVLSADQSRMRVVAAMGGNGPAMLGWGGDMVASVLRSRRPGSTAVAAESGLDAEGQRWLGTSATRWNALGTAAGNQPAPPGERRARGAERVRRADQRHARDRRANRGRGRPPGCHRQILATGRGAALFTPNQRHRIVTGAPSGGAGR
jgi:hypothetical protein